MSNQPQRLYTIAEAATLTGLSPKAIRSRCDRGQLRHVKRGGRRLIPLSELQRSGLLEQAAELAGADELVAGDGDATGRLNLELLAELAKAHERIGELQALEQHAASLVDARERQLQAELELERQRCREAQRQLDAAAAELEQLQARTGRGGGLRRLLLGG